MNHMNSKDNFAYLAAGVGIGAAIGILLAPRSGSETRELISSKAHEGTDYVRRTAMDTADRAKQVANRVKNSFADTVSEAAEVGRQAYREATEGTLGDV